MDIYNAVDYKDGAEYVLHEGDYYRGIRQQPDSEQGQYDTDEQVVLEYGGGLLFREIADDKYYAGGEQDYAEEPAYPVKGISRPADKHDSERDEAQSRDSAADSAVFHKAFHDTPSSDNDL
ncbi:hypothetical protein SDC9_202942 [bioreactor metagenome]|uniref:Uncharacterized protein n=1 Tax=bioreactor metagenome TaxID=1076179 RepID=A0A645IVA0_9ZZZZ